VSRADSPARLQAGQYRNAHNLDLRIGLHALCSVNPQGWTPWLFEQIGTLRLAEDARILELGCGPATIWCENSPSVPVGWRIHLSDFSRGMLGDARQRLSELEIEIDRNFAFAVANAEATPFASDHFDAVFANHMLYHVRQRERALAEIARVLHPSGVLVASTLARGSMHQIQTLVRSCTSRRDFEFNRSTKRFSLDNAQERLAPFFRTIEERRYVDALEITEPAPLIGYLRSLISDEPLRDDELAAIEERIRHEIAKHGAFHVDKDSGVLLARDLRS
jgi:ubiquinone/menaquinone biosynthesis C-methylase UbiE